MPTIAIIITDQNHGRLGHAARLNDQLAGASVLSHTVRRADRITGVDRIVLLHPRGQDPKTLLAGGSTTTPLSTFADRSGLRDPWTDQWIAARKWAQTAWRGGLGWATVFDELMPAGPVIAAMEANKAECAFVVRGDWCLFDPVFADGQLDILLENPRAMKLAFTQAAPGLGGLAVHIDTLRSLTGKGVGFGQILDYNPLSPGWDPIGRDMNFLIPAVVRDTARRFIYDTPRSIELINNIAGRMGNNLVSADAETIAGACLAIEADDPQMAFERLPRGVTLELTPRRAATGPITPHHHTTFDRPDMDVDLAGRIVTQLGGDGEIALMIGGLGDALLHPQWDEVVAAAADAGVFGIGIETDMLVERDELARILDLPIDLVVVRLNADTAETYEKVMGVAGYKGVLENMQWLFNERNRRAAMGKGRVGVPWLIPKLVKTPDTLGDLEGFFEKWMRLIGHAIIAPARCGCGQMPDQSPVPMAPPRRVACRQLARRMSILSDATVAQCDQDWHGAAALGDAKLATLADIWRNMRRVAEAHESRDFTSLTLCGACTEWHRP